MPRSRTRPDSAEASRAPKAPAGQEGFAEWKPAVLAHLKGVRGANRIPERIWRDWYVRGLTVDQGDEEARREALNRLTAAERKADALKAR